MKSKNFFSWIMEGIESIPWRISCAFEYWSVGKTLITSYLIIITFSTFLIVKDHYPNFSTTELVVPLIILFACLISEYLNKCVLAKFVPEIQYVSGTYMPDLLYVIVAGIDLMESQQREGIGYSFFRIFMIPIFPIHCYHYEIEDNEVRGLNQQTTYRFHSRAKSNIWEILGIYLHFYTKLVLLVDMFFVLIDFYYLMFKLFA